MTTDMPYRKARTADDAFGELKKHAGRQFDPLAVDAFLKAWREMEIVL